MPHEAEKLTEIYRRHVDNMVKNGTRCGFYDSYANDQDFALYCFLKYYDIQ